MHMVDSGVCANTRGGSKFTRPIIFDVEKDGSQSIEWPIVPIEVSYNHYDTKSSISVLDLLFILVVIFLFKYSFIITRLINHWQTFNIS